jgi:anti-sigma B factor antagonist
LQKGDFMPDEDDFSINDPQHVLDGTNAAGEDEVPTGDSGVLVVQPTDPSLLKITRDGSSITIGFNRLDVPDEVCIAGYRQQVFDVLERNPDCKLLTFDVTGIHLLPSGMLGLLASLKKRVGKVEILNPARDVREALRVTRLNTLFTIRET